jgi:hypothetical protein
MRNHKEIVNDAIALVICIAVLLFAAFVCQIVTADSIKIKVTTINGAGQ